MAASPMDLAVAMICFTEALSSGSCCSPQKVASPLASSVLPKGMNERWRGLGDMKKGIINFLFIYLSVLGSGPTRFHSLIYAMST